MTEQRYKAVQAVIGGGRTVGQVAGEWSVSRQTVHRWLARYELEGLEGLTNRSSRPARCPHQMAAEVEALALELRHDVRIGVHRDADVRVTKRLHYNSRWDSLDKQ